MTIVKYFKFDFNPAYYEVSIRDRNEEEESLLTTGIFLVQRPEDRFRYVFPHEVIARPFFGSRAHIF